jgi:hypothetical protein
VEEIMKLTTNQTAMFILFLVFFSASGAQGQGFSLFFPASELQPQTDDYGNIYQTGPAAAVAALPSQEPPVGIGISPGALYEETTDAQGNVYTTAAVDSTLAAAQVFNEVDGFDDGMWRRRALGPYGAVLESRGPRGTEDCQALRTTVRMITGGAYEIFLLLGDVAQVATDDETVPTPIQAAIEGQAMKTYVQGDGTYIGTYGFNIIEVSLGAVNVIDNGTISVLVDDVSPFEGFEGVDSRSVYAGLRIAEAGTGGGQTSVDIDADNKWTIVPTSVGRTLLMSHGPGAGEDAPELKTEITVAYAGTYEVVFMYMDSNSWPGEGAIFAALGNEPFGIEYSQWNGISAAGGAGVSIPQAGGGTVSGDSLWYYSAVLGVVTVAAGETITVRVDDYPFASNRPYMVSTYEGIKLNVIDGGPVPKEITVSPWFLYEEGEDSLGNTYTTVAIDSSLSADQVFHDAASGGAVLSGDNLWSRRPLGPYGGVLESRAPRGTEDCPTLQTTVNIKVGGTYDVFLLFGDVAQVGTDDAQVPTPIQAAIEGNELKTYVQLDGVYIGSFAFHIIEVPIGSVTIPDNGSVVVLIDDVFNYEGFTGVDSRSVYAGLRIVRSVTEIRAWEIH